MVGVDFLSPLPTGSGLPHRSMAIGKVYDLLAPCFPDTVGQQPDFGRLSHTGAVMAGGEGRLAGTSPNQQIIFK